MSNKPPLERQFVYPTMRQDHDSAKKNGESTWDTVAGRLNFHATAEAFMTALLSNPEMICSGDMPKDNVPGSEEEYSGVMDNIVLTAFDAAERLYAELREYNKDE